MCSLNNSSGRSFGPSGCQVPVGKGICGETRTLEIINEFKRLYEEKMQDIDSNGGGDCLQEKFRLQQEWIDDLTKQNEMLVRAVEELEHEATERVQMLEEKLHQSAQCICEVIKKYREYDVTNDLLDAPLKKVFHLENDQTNLLEFIRRIREEKVWSMDGLKFYEVTSRNLFGEEPEEGNRSLSNDGFEVQKKVEDNECTIGELQRRIDYFNSFGDVEALAKELKCKNEECQSLKQSMEDMRQALTEEVATKHDFILQLKRDYQHLEDRCIQADKQTAFRDDIIKELRKEIKQLKQHVSHPERTCKYPMIESTGRHSREEPYLVINHTRKIVQSGKSTVIYLRHNSKDRDSESSMKQKDSNNNSGRFKSGCSNCEAKSKILQPSIDQANKDDKLLHLCKSENDLYDFRKLLKPVKERLKLPNALANRSKTFVGSTNNVLDTMDFDRNISVPNHIPDKERLQDEHSSLVEGVVALSSELELSKYGMKSFIVKLNEMLVASEKSQKENDILIESNDVSFSQGSVENQLTKCNEIIEIKNKYLKDQFLLIQILVQKLFHVDAGLQFLERRALSICNMNKDYLPRRNDLTKFQESLSRLKDKFSTISKTNCFCLENRNKTLQAEIEHLNKQNCCLELNIKEEKCQIENLEIQFKGFLKDRAELKRKTKACEKECRISCERIEKLNKEKNELNEVIQCLKNDNEKCGNEKAEMCGKIESMKCELNEFKCKTSSCLCEIDELKKENKKLINQIIQLNVENRSLLDTVDSHKNRIDVTMKVTQEEIVKLNETIDELQNTLHKTKQLQEDEEQCKNKEIANLNNTIQQLRNALDESEAKFQKQAKMCKICRDRINVGFKDNAQVQTNINEKDLESQMNLVEKRDEIIKVQNDTLSMLQQELESLKNKEAEVRLERDKNHNVVQQLKCKVTELENALHDAEEKAANLQVAVDLHLNSINVLEASEEKYKIEVHQQRSTIFNLQEALVATKHMLDEMRQKSEENEKEQHSLISNVVSVMECLHFEREDSAKQYNIITGEHDRLKELNFELEMEHCNSLQEIDIQETQLYKYQRLLRSAEIDNNKCRCDLKRLIKQKKCYEEVIVYFREEMALMAQQLQNLQELLTLSNESAQEENCNVMRAFLEVQSANEKLSTQLSVAEQKVVLENQMNKMNESKICELEKIISEKEIDLTRHDQAILNIRQSLKCSLKQNEDLHSTIVALNSTILHLQEAIRKYESENCRSRESTLNCQEQIISCKEKLEGLKTSLDRKTTELCKLEMAYNNQNRTLQSAQLELKQMKEKQKDKQCHMRCIIQDLRDKLTKAEEKLKYLRDDYIQLQTQLGQLTRRDSVKDVEIKRYRKIIGDLKKTLMDLNRTLTNKKFQSKCNNAECKKNMERSETKDLDICLNCPCEVEFYQNIVETLKKTVLDLKKKLTESQKKNQELETEKKEKEILLSEISKSQLQKDKEYNDLRQQLTNKLKAAQAEEARYLELAAQFEKELGSIRQELEVKTMQLNDVKQSCQEINSSRCVQLACAQEEVGTLKEELNRLLRKHCALNVENEKLHNQSAHLQSTVSSLEEKSQLLSGQLEQYLMELQSVQNEKEMLVQKNRELLSELRMLQFSYNTADKQQRYTNDSAKYLENELDKAKNNYDEICSESKNVIAFFRAWLQEQKRINNYVLNKERNYCDTIEKLKRDYEELQCQSCKAPQRTYNVKLPPCMKSVSPPPTCQSPWSLGSQGTASFHDGSPSRSPCPNEEFDWYSTNYQNESEDNDEEDWVSKVEDLAAQVRRTNKMWKSKLCNPDCPVSKDTKK